MRTGPLVILATLSVAAAIPTRGTQQIESPDKLWTRVAPDPRFTLFSTDKGGTPPKQFELFTLATDLLNNVLRQATRTLSRDSPRMSLPMPDGRFRTFRVQETSAMDPALAESTGIRTYRGVAEDDAAVVARFEIRPEGLHSVIMSKTGRVLLEPTQQQNERVYVSYEVSRQQIRFPDESATGCLVTPLEAARAVALRIARKTAARAEPEPAGSVHRIYRLAIGATGEYSAFHGGTVDKALGAIISTVNRVNEVYETDLAVTFHLVAKQRDLIHLDPKKDPYNNNSPDALLKENEAVLAKVVGADGFDIGHVFSTGGGGKAVVGSVCGSSKARGVTGRKRPLGDPFSIDYVAHEIGHQMGANHSFNSTIARCSNRHSATAYEPGSGSTVMGYAGICDEANLQPNSQAYFHAGSLTEIREFITDGDGASCGTQNASGNTPPTVSVTQQPVIVPKRTPFALSGSATDKSATPLTFTWEQMDLGPEAPPDDDVDGHLRPLFRSYAPGVTADRWFPQAEVLLNGVSILGEIQAASPRVMRFRLTARDNASPAGAFGYADVRVSVVAAGPFQVTHPTATTKPQAGTELTVRWAVNNTDKPPLSCAKVRISLSVDGGQTYHVVVADTPNDGSENVKLPVTASQIATIRVDAVPGSFFSSSPLFTIGSTTALQVSRREN